MNILNKLKRKIDAIQKYNQKNEHVIQRKTNRKKILFLK